MRLLTFTTADYEPLAHRCRVSFSQWLDIDVRPLPRLDTWMQTCLSRSMLILEAFDPKEPLGLIDADIVALRRPESILEAIDGDWDVMLDDRGPCARPRDRMSAQLVIFKGDGGQALLHAWASLCQLDPNPELPIREQQYLLRTVQESRPRLRNLNGRILVPPKGWDGFVPDGIEMLHVPASRDLEGTAYLNARL